MAKKPGKQDKHGHNFVSAKPLDKHGITLVHIIYPPLGGLVGLFGDRGPNKTPRNQHLGTKFESLYSGHFYSFPMVSAIERFHCILLSFDEKNDFMPILDKTIGIPKRLFLRSSAPSPSPPPPPPNIQNSCILNTLNRNIVTLVYSCKLSKVFVTYLYLCVICHFSLTPCHLRTFST